jgi:Putative adhesin
MLDASTARAWGAGTYQVTTNAGKVGLTFAKPPDSVRVKSDVGEVTLTVPGNTKYAVTADATVGSKDVPVDTDPSSQHRIDVSTSVGSITINKG